VIEDVSSCPYFGTVQFSTRAKVTGSMWLCAAQVLLLLLLLSGA
jgi:hypothetical protein